MADRINGYGRTGLDVGPAKARSVPRSTQESGDGNAAKAAKAEKARDGVEITETATRLKAIETKLAHIPDVDQARVEATRQRIESGEYRPDAARIAERLMRLERQLA